MSITREQFMEFFRSEEFHSLITPDDAAEIFTGVLHGSSDLEDHDMIVGLYANYGQDTYDLFCHLAKIHEPHNSST